MSREEKLAKGTIIYFIGSFGSKILSFILLPVYAKYLTTEAYGDYDLINTVIQIVYPVITMMLDNALYVYLISTDDKKRKQDIISFAIKTLFLNSIIAVGICLILNCFFEIKYIEWIILWLISYSAYSTWIQLCRGLYQQKLFSLTGVIVTSVILVGNIIGLVVLKQDYRFLMISNCAAYSISIIFLESKLHVFSYAKKGKASKELKKELLRYTLPLMPNQLSWWILNVSDRLMISFYLGTGANGLYAMACKIPAILNVVHSVFSAAWSDDILSSDNIRETEVYAEKIYNMYFRILIGVSMVLMAANKFIFEYIIGGNFVQAYKYTYFLYLGFLFTSLGSLLGAFYGYYKKSLNVSLSTIVGAIVNFVINLMFLNTYGIQVASISTLVGAITVWIIRLLGLKNLVNIRISTANKLMVLTLIPFYFVYNINGIIANLMITCIGIILAIIINFNTLKSMINKIVLRGR